MSFFTSSSLSPVAPSPRKTNGAFLQDSDEEGGPLLESEMETDNDDDGQQVASGPGLADDEFEVEAILARKGGYNGKTLMYKIRWVRRSCAALVLQQCC